MNQTERAELLRIIDELRQMTSPTPAEKAAAPGNCYGLIKSSLRQRAEKLCAKATTIIQKEQ